MFIARAMLAGGSPPFNRFATSVRRAMDNGGIDVFQYFKYKILSANSKKTRGKQP
jgi:hypothetical protein